tara:strand:- start:529 stop:1005 length:477 start_codon:yes stop_codon:yes gene_type:complete
MENKKFEDYNARDLHLKFMELYEQLNSEPYNVNTGKNKSPFPFVGDEVKGLKKLLESKDIYLILCGMYNAIGQNTTYFSVLNFINSFERYQTQHDPKLYWHVISKGTAKVKQAWMRYNVLKATWFPNARQTQELKTLEERFEKWLEGQEKVASSEILN